MGFVEVIKNLGTILKNLSFCKEDIGRFHPDVLILIDYPGFNLRIAKWAKSKNIRVFYYISPQIWAWHSSRIHQIRQNVDRMFVILPFEKEYYANHHYDVDFIGHPLLDAVSDFRPDADFLSRNQLSDKPIIAILPGSRRQEIASILPIALSITGFFPDHQFVIAAAPSQNLSYYRSIVQNEDVRVVEHQTYQLLYHSCAAIVASGTATLETALFNVPEVVVYKGNWISYQIAKHLIYIKFISLVNLIADSEIVRELIQGDFNLQNLKKELERLLEPERQQQMKERYANLREIMGQEGASARCAQKIFNLISNINK